MEALQKATTHPSLVGQFFSNDVNCNVKVEPKEKILTESEKTLHQLENELDRLNVNKSSKQQIEAFCIPALKKLENILQKEKSDALVIEQTEKLIKIVREILSNAKLSLGSS